jgi:GH24 family phage-related lysozyme (muramidase)
MKHFIILTTLFFLSSFAFAQLTITGPTQTCPGSTYNYTANLSGGGIGMGSYNWSLNGTNVGFGFSVNITIPSGASSHVLTVNYVERGNPSASESETIYINNPFAGIVNLNSSPTICYMESASISVGLQRLGPNGSGNFQKRSGSVWQDISTPGTSINVHNLTADTDFRFKITNSCGTQYSNVVSVSVWPTLNPGSINGSKTICYDSSPGTFGNASSASGGNGSYSYQWEVSTNGGTGYSDIPGATSASYTPNGTLTGTRHYRRKASSCDEIKATSAVVVTVRPTLNPGSINGSKTICYDSSPGTFGNASSASGGNGSYSYQWEVSTNGGTGYSDIPGATSASYTPNGTLTGTRHYRRKASSCGETKATSAVVVTVRPTLNPGSINGSKTICYDSYPGTFGNASSASGGNGSYSYQWEVSTNGGTGYSDIPGATSASYIPNGTLTGTRHYRRKASSCDEIKATSAVVVTVRPTLNPGSINGSKTICYDSSPGTFGNASSASGGNGSYSYQWEVSTNGGTGYSDIPGATSASYTPNGTLTGTRHYRRKASSCDEIKATSAVVVTVRPTLNPGSINGSKTICYDSSPGTFGNASSASGGNGSYSYQWEVSTNGGTGYSDIPGATSASYTPNGTLTGTRHYRRKASSCDEIKATSAVVVTVRPTLNPGSINGSKTICSDESIGILGSVSLATGGNGSYNYQWQVSSDGGNNYSNLSGETSTSYRPPENLIGTWHYRRRVTSCNQSVFTNVIIISVNEVPNVTPGPNLTQYQFENSINLSGTGESPQGGNYSGSYVSGNHFNATQSGIDNHTVTYTYTNAEGCSASASKTIYVEANPEISVDGPNDIVWGENRVLSVPDDFASYQWYVDGEAIAGATNPTYTVETKGDFHVEITAYSGATLALEPASIINRTSEQNENMIQTVVYKTALEDGESVRSVNEGNSQITFFDGLGRQVQTIMMQASPDKNDLVSPVEYDARGNVTKKYLPYEEGQKDGILVSDALRSDNGEYTGSNQYDFYASPPNDKIASTIYPYQETVVEKSPLKRPLAQYAPGDAWAKDNAEEGRPVTTGYFINESTDDVMKFHIANDELVQDDNYGDNALEKTVNVDENNNKSITFTNSFGQEILKRNYKSTTEYYDTYYVYDKRDNLRFVLPPMASKEFLGELTSSEQDTIMKNFAYQYFYDGKNRMVEKKLPGVEPQFMIYDNYDRLILTQDGEQRLEDLYSFTKYDAMGRVIITGVVKLTDPILDIREDAKNSSAGKSLSTPYDTYESRTDTDDILGYTNEAYPTITANDVRTVTYYDDYDFFHASQSEFHFVADELNDTYNPHVKGQVAGSMTKVLGTNSQWLRSINYYDDKYRLIQAVTENHKGGVNRVSNQYDFVGNVLKTKTNQFKPKPISIRNQYNVVPYADGYKSTSESSGWNSRFSTVNMLAAGQDGWFETRIDELASKRYIGLTDNDVTDFTDQLFRIYLKQGDLRAFTAGGTSMLLGQLQVGDIIRVQRVGGVVSVLQNGTEVHSFNHTNNQRLFIDVSMNQGGTVTGLKTNFIIPESSNEEEIDILWTAVENINISEDGSTITKQGADSWSNNNASSLNALKGGEDGVLSFEAGQADKELVVGLTNKDTGTGYAGIMYGLNLKANGDLAVRENGNYHGGLGSYMTGDKFEVIRMDGVIYYYKNGGLLYESTIPFNDRLIVDVSLKTSDAFLENMKVSFKAPEFNSVDITITENFTYDHVDRLMEVTHEMAKPVKWENIIGYEIDENNNLVHTGADHYNNTTANTSDLILENSNGFIEVRPESYSRMLFGLNDEPEGTSYTDMEYCIYTATNENIYVYENGSNKTNMGHYNLGDILRVEVRAGKVYYTKNGEVLYISTKEVSSDLYGDVTSFYTGNSITNALFSTSGRQLMVSNEYNELGELINKKLHQETFPFGGAQGGTFAQSVDYRYNIRGWLKRINHADLTADNAGEKTDLFGMELGYTDDLGTSAGPQFNGNIAAVKWGGKRNDIKVENVVQQNSYGYGYDGLNRITEADFYESAAQTPGQKYQLRINEYDQNGNIKQLQRRDAEGVLIDDLTYDYTGWGNQLKFVSDAEDVEAGFKDGNASGEDYTYDENGNMTSDANKEIETIKYNYLNLPQEVVFENGNKINYIYSASGTKLRQEVYEDNSLIKTTDYIGSLIVQNDTLQFIQTAEGRVVPKTVDGVDKNEYQYHLKDHLGNVRSTFAVRDDDWSTGFETATHPYFKNYDDITILPNQYKRSGDYSHRLTGGGTDIVGLMKTLYVSKGDKLSAEVYGKYLDAQFTDDGINGGALISALVGMFNNTPLSGEGTTVQNNLNTNFLSAAMADGSEEESPKAYLNYIMLDKNFNYVNSGFERLSESAADPGDGSGTHQKLSFEEIAIEEDGYLMVFLSNESQQSVEVFWDDFKVDHLA